MNFLDGSLFPENQEKLVITAAPYGPEWIPSDFPEDIPVTMWDNRSTQHYAVMDYPPCHRKMERAGIIGDKPY